MIELITILGSVLLILISVQLVAKFQVKRLTQKTVNLQKKAATKVERLKKIEELTKQKLLTMSYTEQVAKFISDGLVVANRNKILYVNPAVSKMTGYSVEELIDKPWADLIPEEHVVPNGNVICSKEHDEVEINGVFHFLNHWKCKDGRIITLWWTATPFDENGICYAICRDVSRDNGKKQKIDKLISQMVGTDYEGDVGVILDKAQEGIIPAKWSKASNE